jgi:hypothetical protein
VVRTALNRLTSLWRSSANPAPHPLDPTGDLPKRHLGPGDVVAHERQPQGEHLQAEDWQDAKNAAEDKEHGRD